MIPTSNINAFLMSPMTSIQVTKLLSYFIFPSVSLHHWDYLFSWNTFLLWFQLTLEPKVFFLSPWISFVFFSGSFSFSPPGLPSGLHLYPLITWHWVFFLRNLIHRHVIEYYLFTENPDFISAAQISTLFFRLTQ